MGAGTPGRPPAVRQPIKLENGRSNSSGMNRGGNAVHMNRSRGRKVSSSEDEEPQYRRESSRRKAKEQSKVNKIIFVFLSKYEGIDKSTAHP